MSPLALAAVKLFYKLLIFFLLASLLPLALVGWHLLKGTEASLTSAGAAIELSQAERAADAVHRRLDRVETELRTLMSNPRFFSQGRENMRGQLEALLAEEPSLQALTVYDAVGTKVETVSRHGMVNTLPTAKEWGRLRQETFKTPLVRQAPFYSEDGRAYLPSVGALKAGRGRVAGYLQALMSTDVLSEALGVAPGKEGMMYVQIPDGRSIAVTPHEPNTPVLDWNTAFSLKVPVPGTDWTLLRKRPKHEALNLLFRVRKRVWVSLALAGLLAVLFCTFLTRALVKPLRQFSRAVHKMKSGDFRSLVELRSKDEMGDLARELRDAQSDLEKKTRDSVLGKMARLISHDIRIPLQTIQHSVENLEKGADERVLRHVKLIRAAAQAAQNFVEEILAVGREREPILRPLCLNTLVKSVMEGMTFREGVSVNLRLDENLPKAHLDDKIASRAVANVIKNAHEAVDPARGRVDIRTGAEDGYVTLTVSDNGEGIPQEKQKKLFEEFSTKEGGSGLGMLVVKKAMDQHNGFIQVNSRPGGGTILALLFPVSKGR